MIPKPSSPIKIPESGMIRCVFKVCARDVDHKKYNSKYPYFYGIVIPWSIKAYGYTRLGYVTVQVIGDGEYTVSSHENCNSNGVSIEITCMKSDLRFMLRKCDSKNIYLSDNDLVLDPLCFFEKDSRDSWIIKNLINKCVF